MNQPWSTQFDGQPAAPPESKRFDVGEFTFEYSECSIRYLKWRGQEIVRRIYFALRDEHWGTLPYQVTSEQIRQQAGEIEILFGAQCNNPHYGLKWEGGVSARADGTLSFSTRATPLVGMKVNRVGLCLLHPPDSLTGRSITITTSAQQQRQIVIRPEIHPDNPASDIQSMQLLLDDGSACRFEFKGESFEMEDQRNWIDDSFKTFCRPLSKPRPFELALGHQIEQSIQLMIEPSTLNADSASASGRPIPDVIDSGIASTGNCTVTVQDSEVIEIRIQHEQVSVLNHSVGIGWSERNRLVTAADLEKLKLLKPAFLRIDLTAGERDWTAKLCWARDQSKQLDCGIELGLRAGSAQIHLLDELLSALVAMDLRLDRVLLLNCDSWVTAPEMIDRAVQWRSRRSIQLPLYAGTHANFTELNRQRPDHPQLDGLCYAAQPQEHARDNQSLIETPAALGETVVSASRFAPNGQVCVGPVTLRKQVNPYGAPPSELATADSLPETVDARQACLLGAGWTLACLKYLAESGAVASSWYEIGGWKGILMPSEPQAAFEHHPLFPARPGMVYPLYHVLADWQELRGARFFPTRSSDRLRVECVVAEQNGRLLVLLANMQGSSQSVRLPCQASEIVTRRLHLQTYERACMDPSEFRQTMTKTTISDGDAIELEPFEYSVITLPSGSSCFV